MLLNHQQRKILELLCKTEHVTASELAGQLGIGVKTVRVRIKELNPELEKKGIQILSKSRYGYYLDPRQPEGIEGLLNPKENEDPVIPSNNQERVHFLLAYLLNRTEYIKSEELCDFLYISKGTLTHTLRQVIRSMVLQFIRSRDMVSVWKAVNLIFVSVWWMSL